MTAPAPPPGFDLPATPPGTDPASSVSLGALVVWRTTLAGLRGAARGSRLLLAEGPLHPRLVHATRIALRTDGPAFLEGEQAVCLEVEGHPPARHVMSGQTLIDLLDLLHDAPTGRLVDGAPASPAPDPDAVRVVAFYLPQFYPFDVNDAAWGEGFTEWANVLSATPHFPGHEMPLLPAELGFYDTRLPELRRRQGELARQYGVDAFCYHFYWFSGRRVMREVLDDILYSGQPDLPFCLCWANETWSRRWDGSQDDILVPQEHDPAIDETLIEHLLPFFRDDRYLRVEGKPVLVIYRLGIMNEAERVIAAWRRTAEAEGLPGLFVVAARTFGLVAEEAAMVDALVDFPPHTSRTDDMRRQVGAPEAFRGHVFDYRQAVVNAASEPPGATLHLPGIMPRWDNTPRRGAAGHAFIHATPAAFQLWASLALARAAALKPDHRLLFVNAWNEWGEGAMLEPDRRHGRAYLEALRRARAGYLVTPQEESRFRLVSGLPPDGATAYLDSFAATVNLAQQVLARLHGRRSDAFRPGAPGSLAGLRLAECDSRGTLDKVSPAIDAGRLILEADDLASLTGWAVLDPHAPHAPERVAFLALCDPKSGAVHYHLPVTRWTRRTDVRDVHAAGLADEAAYFGFSLGLTVGPVAPSTYDLRMIGAVESRVVRLGFAITLVRL